MSENEEKGSLAHQSISLAELGINLVSRNFAKNLAKRNLDKAGCTRITNAWQEGTIVDQETGVLWVRRDKLASILCTTDPIARFIFGGVDTKDKQTRMINEKGGLKSVECLSISQVTKELTNIIMNPGGLKQRVRGQFSFDHLTAILNSPEIDIIIGIHLEYVNSKQGDLKKARIKRFNLTADELTGEPFHTSSQRSHFSHIRGKRTCVRLAIDINNGLVVNDETHGIITKAGVEDEHELLKICEIYSWNTSWYRPYVQRFKD
jgi:hypothetical protein